MATYLDAPLRCYVHYFLCVCLALHQCSCFHFIPNIAVDTILADRLCRLYRDGMEIYRDGMEIYRAGMEIYRAGMEIYCIAVGNVKLASNSENLGKMLSLFCWWFGPR